MKKLLVALLVVFCGLPCLAQTREPVYVDGVNVYSKPKIYANSFDGFLNMRSAPSTSAKIVGAFRNGEIPGYVIKQEGNWAKIYYQGVTGYVYKKNTTSTPTVAVTIDVDGEWLQGVWVHMEGFESYAFFNNGTGILISPLYITGVSTTKLPASLYVPISNSVRSSFAH